MSIQLSAHQIKLLPPYINILIQEQKKDKDLRLLLTSLLTEVELGAKQGLSAIDIKLDTLQSSLHMLLQKQPTPTLFKYLSCIPLEKLSFNGLQLPDYLIVQYFEPLTKQQDCVFLLQQLLKQSISSENHLKLLISAFKQIPNTPDVYYQAIALSCMKYDTVPEIFTKLVSLIDKQLKNIFQFDQLGHNFDAYEKQQFTNTLPDFLLILLQNYPHNALTEDLTELFYQIYSKLIQLIPISAPQLQNKYLNIIEYILKIFLSKFPISLFFDHIYSFCIRILNFAEVPNFQLKSAIIMHLTRLFTSDSLEFNIFNQLTAEKCSSLLFDLEATMPQKFSSETANAEFQLFQRVNMPPGRLLALIYVNFDSKFSSPNLFSMIFDVLSNQIQIIKKLQKSNKQLVFTIEPIENCRFYQINLTRSSKRILSRLTDENAYYSKVCKFLRCCGIVNHDNNTFLNQKVEHQGEAKYTYVSTSLLSSVRNAFSRLIDSLANNFNICDFSLKYCDFQPDFGMENLNQIENPAKKIKMQAGFELFEESPLKAIQFFEKLNFIPELISVENLEEVVEEAKKRVKRTFEEEFENTLKLISEHEKLYVNAKEYYQSVVQFVIQYLKVQTFEIGISRVAFGELIGGSKVQNKCVLHAFVEYFSEIEFGNQQKVDFVQCLRDFLSYFKLPGEGQVIDRIVSFFSFIYSRYAGMDHKTIHGLSYAVIMLNTDLHNSSMKDKMTKENFIRNTKLIDYAKQLTDPFLTQIYDEILQNPFTLGSIEEIKVKFAILSKYLINDDENETPNNQEVRLVPKVTRYGQACLEWVKYGMKQFNTEIQTIEEFTFMNCIFNEEIGVNLVKHLGVQKIQELLDLTRILKPSWTSQLCFQTFLKICLRNNLSEIRQELIEIYISYSDFLENPIIQRPNYDTTGNYIIQYKGGQAVKNVASFPVITSQKLDLIQILVDQVSFRQQIGNELEDYGPRIEFGSTLLIIGEILSRCNYVDLLLRKCISRKYRNANSSSPEALRQDLMESLFMKEDLVNNYITIMKYFNENQTIAKIQKLIINASALDNEEFKYFIQVLSMNSQTEQQISLNIDYQQYSISKLISTLSIKLEENMQQFEEIYPLITISIVKILSTSNQRLGSNIAISVHQIIMQYLLKNRSSENSTLFYTILSPFTDSLVSCDLYMVSIILSYLGNYLTLFDKNSPPNTLFLTKLIDTISMAVSRFNEICQQLMKKLDKSMNMKSQIVQLQNKEFVREVNQNLVQTINTLSAFIDQEEKLIKMNYLVQNLNLIPQNDNWIISVYLDTVSQYQLPLSEDLQQNICKIINSFLIEQSVEKRVLNQMTVRDFLLTRGTEFLVAFCQVSLSSFSSDGVCNQLLNGNQTCSCGCHCGCELVKFSADLNPKIFGAMLARVDNKQILNMVIKVMDSEKKMSEFYQEQIIHCQFKPTLIKVYDKLIEINSDNKEYQSTVLLNLSQFLLSNQERLSYEDWRAGVGIALNCFTENQSADTAEWVSKVLQIELSNPLSDRIYLFSVIGRITRSLFVDVFKKQLYNSILDGIMDSNEDVRRLVQCILREQYTW